MIKLIILSFIFTENNLVVDLNPQDAEISGIVQALSTNKQVCDGQLLVEKRTYALRLVQEELLKITSMEEMDAALKILAPLKPTLAAVRSQQELANNFPVASTSTPHNKNIMPQRRIFSTKKGRKPKATMAKPSAEEADNIAFQLLHRE